MRNIFVYSLCEKTERELKKSIPIFLFLFCTFLIAQESKVDSLKGQLLLASGTKKADILNHLAEALPREDTVSRGKYASEALELSLQLNYKYGIASAKNNIALSLFQAEKYDEAIPLFRASLIEFTALNNPAKIGELNFNIGDYFYFQGNSDSAIVYFNKALQLFTTVKDSVKTATTLMHLGFQYWGQGKFSESLKYFKGALKIREALNMREPVGNSLNSIGSAYWKTGNYLKAMEYFQKSLRIREEMNDEIGMIISWNNIGTIYQKLQYFDNAEKLYNNSLEIAVKINYDFGIAYSYYNFGLLNLDKEELDKSLSYFFQSYAIAENMLTQNLRTMILYYIGFVYEKKLNYKKAEDYYNNALNIAEQTRDKHAKSLIYQGLSRTNLALNNLKVAENYLNKGHLFALEESFLEILRDNYLLYYKINLGFNKKLAALEYHKLYAEMEDSLYKAGLRNSISNMMIKYEIEKTESEKQLLQSEKQLIEKEKDFQITLRNLFIALTVLALIMALVLVYFYLFRLKTSKRIEEQKHELEKLNEQLNVQNSQLLELNKNKDRLFSLIAHDLKSPFHSLLGFSELLKSEVDEMSKDEIKEYAANIHESGVKLLTLIQNLLDWAKGQLQKVTISRDEFDLCSVINDAINIYQKIADAKHVRLVNKCSNEVIISADKNMIESVVRNLISNAIKFTDTSGIVEAKLKTENNSVLLSIKDTGVGMDEKTLSKIFKLDMTFSLPGTKNEKGTGLGLNLCKEFIEKNEGKIWAESKPGEGSEFFISIPAFKQN